MKIINRVLLVCFSVMLLACTDEIQNSDRAEIAKATAPVLLSPTTGNLVLLKVNAAAIATSVVWNDAAYSGTTTVVNYSIEIAKKGTNFATPTVVSTTTSRFKSLTVDEFNTGVLNANLAPFVEHEIEMRIKSTIGTTGGVPQYSNVTTLKVTAYPSWPNWGIIGSATPTGWGSDTNMDYSLATKLYSITIPMLVGEYKFRLDDAWTFNFGDNGNNLGLDEGGANIPITIAGSYRITVNFSAVAAGGIAPLTYTVVRLP
jgi:hypothetical protein